MGRGEELGELIVHILGKIQLWTWNHTSRELLHIAHFKRNSPLLRSSPVKREIEGNDINMIICISKETKSNNKIQNLPSLSPKGKDNKDFWFQGCMSLDGG